MPDRLDAQRAIFPDSIFVADASGNIAMAGMGGGVGFLIESSSEDETGASAVAGQFPISAYFDYNDTYKKQIGGPYPVMFGAKGRFSQMGLTGCTPLGAYRVHVFREVDQHIGSISLSPNPSEELIYSSYALGQGNWAATVANADAAGALGPTGSRGTTQAALPSYLTSWKSTTCWDVTLFDTVRVRVYTIPVAPSGGMTNVPIDVELWPSINGPADATLFPTQPYAFSARAAVYTYQTLDGHQPQELEIGAGMSGVNGTPFPSTTHGKTGCWPVKAKFLRLGLNPAGAALAADNAACRRWVEIWGKRR
jgi:hypothetical protein